MSIATAWIEGTKKKKTFQVNTSNTDTYWNSGVWIKEDSKTWHTLVPDIQITPFWHLGQFSALRFQHFSRLRLRIHVLPAESVFFCSNQIMQWIIEQSELRSIVSVYFCLKVSGLSVCIAGHGSSRFSIIHNHIC